MKKTYLKITKTKKFGDYLVDDKGNIIIKTLRSDQVRDFEQWLDKQKDPLDKIFVESHKPKRVGKK